MGMGAAILLFAVGAILVWGVNAEVRGVDVDAIGVILMIVGLAGAMVSAMFWESMPWYRGRRRVTRYDEEL